MTDPALRFHSPDDGELVTWRERSRRHDVTALYGEEPDWVVRPPVSEVITDAVAVVADDRREQWHTRWVFAEQGGRYTVRSVTIEPQGQVTPASGVTADVLRSLSPASMSAVARQLHDEPDDPFWRLMVRWRSENAAASGVVGAQPRQQGRPRMPDADLALVAEAYLRELGRGRGLHQRMADVLAEPLHRKPGGLPVETVRDWIQIARKRGFLTSASKQGARGAAAGSQLVEFRNGMREQSK